MSAAPPDDHARRAYDAFAPFYDALTAAHRYDAWTRTLEGWARDAGLRGRRLLDVACGTGKSFAPFLERGYTVTACDVSPAMLALAAERAAGRASLSVQDMRRLPRLGAFDLVCCLDDAINYLHTEAELVATLRGFARNLAPGGVALFDANTLHSYRTFFAGLTVLPSADQVLLCDGRTPPDLPPGGEAPARLEALHRDRDGRWRRVRTEHVQRHHPPETVRAAIAAAGLRCAAVHGMHLDGSTTDEADEEVNSKAVYVVRRAGGPSRPQARDR